MIVIVDHLIVNLMNIHFLESEDKDEDEEDGVSSPRAG